MQRVGARGAVSAEDFDNHDVTPPYVRARQKFVKRNSLYAGFVRTAVPSCDGRITP